MGSIIPSLAPTCMCSPPEDDHILQQITVLKKECDEIKERLLTFEIHLENKHSLTSHKIETLETKIDAKLDIIEEKFTRIGDKIDTKFDILMLTVQQNKR